MSDVSLMRRKNVIVNSFRLFDFNLGDMVAIGNLSEIQGVSVAIRDAVAPVFLLTGIGSILSVLVNRLGRSVDRARFLNGMSVDKRRKYLAEFDIIVRRTAWIRRSIGLITLAALCVCMSIASLFIEVKIGLNMPDLVSLTFITSMLLLIAGLSCFLREIILASREIIAPDRDSIE